jgi:hypothetical protein
MLSTLILQNLVYICLVRHFYQLRCTSLPAKLRLVFTANEQY